MDNSTQPMRLILALLSTANMHRIYTLMRRDPAGEHTPSLTARSELFSPRS